MQDNANKQADSILIAANHKTMLSEYEEAYDLISRFLVWFALPTVVQKKTRKNMLKLCREFMEKSHCPYED